MGFDLVKAIAPGLGYLIPHVAFRHHERQDGSGYPRGLPGNNTLGKREKNTLGCLAAVKRGGAKAGR